MYMSKHNTLKKIVAVSVVAGTAMHIANNYITKYATAKNLLNRMNGHLFPFKYGNVFYKVSGKGKPVLLIHDINETSSGIEWFYLEKKLAKTNKVYTIDLLGCGRSEKPKLVYNNFLYVQLINDFIKEVIGEPVNIIATGKSVAPVVMACKLCKDSIDQIIFINPMDLSDLSEVPDTCCKIKRAILSTPVVGTFIYHICHRKASIQEQFFCNYYSNPKADFEELCEYYYESAHKDQSGSRYLFASIQGYETNMNIYHAIKSIDKDIIVISGNDYLESESIADEYVKMNKNIESISIMNTSYLPQLEAPSKVMDIIEQYWK